METITKTPAAAPAFHADDADEVVGYRTLSALAIVSLVFGLVSPLCLAWALLTGIPLLGAVISIVALRRIDGSHGALAGRWAAAIGLVLCVASGTAAVSRDFVERAIRTHQAESVGRGWIELLLEGKADDAFKLTMGAHRVAPTTPEPGVPAPTKTPQQFFLEDPIVSTLAAAGPDAEVVVGETGTYEPQPRRQFIIQKAFVVKPNTSDAKSHGDTIELHVTLQRMQLTREPEPRWLVSAYETEGAEHEAAHQHEHNHQH